MFNLNVETLPMTYSIKGYKKRQISLLKKIAFCLFALVVIPSLGIITFFVFRISENF